MFFYLFLSFLLSPVAHLPLLPSLPPSAFSPSCSGDPDDLDNGKPSKKRPKTVGAVDPDEDVDSMDSNSTPKPTDTAESGAASAEGTLPLNDAF